MDNNNTIWKTPEIDDISAFSAFIENSGAQGCDSSPVNIFLYRHRYCTEIKFTDEFLLRRYNCTKHLKGYGFPLGSGNIRLAVEACQEDAQMRGELLEFVQVTDYQKRILEKIFPDLFDYIEIRNDADYLYEQKSLSVLSGKKYHKKKNHISQFFRKHPDCHFELLSEKNKIDAWKVEEHWFANTESYGKDDLEYERDIIREALVNMNSLCIRGGILYSDRHPIAMTMGSLITHSISDTHFEKALHEYDRDGAYAVINQYFAQSLPEIEFINREEDLGIEGLRHAKLSYHPQILLTKYKVSRKNGGSL